MFTTLTSLDAEQHRSLRFTPNQPYDFAREMVLIPIVASEVTRIAREMPIVFPKEQGVPQALVGVNPGENLHVQDSGHWVGRYVPAHLRRYPFLLAKVSATAEKGRQYAIQFDADARHFERPDGYALLDAQGQPTQMLKKVQQVLMGLQHDHERTLALVAQLEDAGLLVEKTISVSQEAQKQALGGMRLVDDKKFAELEPATLATLRNSGALALVYAHFLSLTNLQDGLIAKTPSGKDTAPDLEEFFDDDEDLTFNFDD